MSWFFSTPVFNIPLLGVPVRNPLNYYFGDWAPPPAPPPAPPMQQPIPQTMNLYRSKTPGILKLASMEAAWG